MNTKKLNTNLSNVEIPDGHDNKYLVVSKDGKSITYKDGGGGGGTPTQKEIYDLDEKILKAGSNIELTPDDTKNTITIIAKGDDTKLDINMDNASNDTKKYINDVIKGNLHNENYPDLTTVSKTIIDAINEAAHSGGGGKTPVWKEITHTFDAKTYDDSYSGTIWRVHTTLTTTSGATPPTFKAIWTTFIKKDLYIDPKDYTKSIIWQNDLGWAQGKNKGLNWGNIEYRNNYYDITIIKVEESSYQLPISGGGSTFVPTQANIYPTIKPMLKAGNDITIIPDDTNHILTINSTGGGGGTAPTKDNIYPINADMIKAGAGIFVEKEPSTKEIAIKLDHPLMELDMSNAETISPQGIAKLYTVEKATLKAGTNVTITPDDTNRVLTIESTGGGTSGANVDLSNITQKGKGEITDLTDNELKHKIFKNLKTTTQTIIGAINELMRKSQPNSFTGKFSSQTKADEFLAIKTNTLPNEFENEDQVKTIRMTDVETIKNNFMAAVPLTAIDLPFVINIEKNSFTNAPLTKIDISDTNVIYDDAFTKAVPTELFLPKLTQLGSGNFEDAPLTYLDLSSIETDTQIKTVFNKLVNAPTTTFVCSGFMGFNANMAKIFPNGWNKITVKPTSNGYTGAWSDKAVATQFMQVTDNVADNEFETETNIHGIALPHVKMIGNNAFNKLTSLPDNVYLPKCTNINQNAFANVTQGLETLTLPEVTYIDINAFENAPIEFLVAPNLKHVSDGAFKGNNLKTLDLPNLISIGDYGFEVGELITLNIPKVTHIGKRGFSDALLKTLDLPEVLEIGDNGFQQSILITLSLPKCQKIGIAAFEHSLLTTLDLPQLISLKNGAFSECPLTKLSIPLLEKAGLDMSSDIIFEKIINQSSTTVTMKTELNTDEYKKHLFGDGNYDKITYTLV